MEYIPHHYQQKATDFILEKRKCALWLDMGLGKTAATLDAIKTLLKTDDALRVLVIAPLRVAKNVWPAEIEKWDCFRELNYCVIAGTPKKREEQVRKHYDIHIINYDLVAWFVNFANKLEYWPWDMLILDESSQVKNPSTMRVRALRKVIKKFEHIVELTGTPAPNGLKNLWSQIFLLDHGDRLGKTHAAFKARWFHVHPKFWTLTPRIYAQKEIQDKISDITVTMQAKDYITIPPVIKNTIPIFLNEAQMRNYKKLERDMFINIAEIDVEIFNAAALTNKCLQYSNGAVYVDKKGNWEEIHKHKLNALENIVEEAAGAPVLVCYQYKFDAIRIAAHFPEAKIMDKKAKTINDWNRGTIPILIMHPASAGHGLNLQDGGNILVWFGIPWNLEHYQQANARLHRQNQTKTVFVHHLVTHKTIDEIVMQRLATKKSVQNLLLEALRLRQDSKVAA